MRTLDTIILGEAYSKIRTLEEAKFRDIIASANNRVDKPIPDQPETQQEAKEESAEAKQHKAKTAYDKAVQEKKTDIETLKDISLDKDVAKKYAGHLVLMGYDVPDIIRDATKAENLN
jgi:hypothetical protein